MSRGSGVVRILLVGEPLVGKTTLILSLVNEKFSHEVPDLSDEITIPASVTPEQVPTEIVDFSARIQSRDQLIHEIRLASVVCLVYALNDENFLRHITDKWLPLIRSCFAEKKQRVPVVLVGNKLDLISTSKMELVLPLMESFPEIETCIECSAKSLLNLSETFWFAQKAVLYPTAPLYNAETKELTPECVCALSRIFHICDVDYDGYLSDKELEAFQERCFAIPLTTQSLMDVKQLIRNSTAGGVTVNGVTLKGFLFLHLIFIRKGRHETTWTVLRQFGYDNCLCLFPDSLFPNLVIPPGCSTELSPVGLRFLHTIFTKYDADGDECLSPAEVAGLLATCPGSETKSDTDGMPLSSPRFPAVGMEDFGTCVETNSNGWITRRGFIAHWAMTALLEPSRALKYLAYLGFTYQSGTNCVLDKNHQHLSGVGLTSTSSDSAQASHLYGCIDNAAKSLLCGLTITSERRMDYIRGHTNRTVFYCRVYGSRMVGKTCLLQGLLGRGLRGREGTSVGGVTGRTSVFSAATGIPVSGNLRTLILHEISAGDGEQMSNAEALSADVVCLLYDSTDRESFRYVANIFLNFYRGTRVPCLFIAGKADQTSVLQDYYLDPQEFCVKYHLHDPIPFSSFDVQPRFMEGGSGQVDGARHRRSSADTITQRRTLMSSPTGKQRTSWFIEDTDSPEASSLRSEQCNNNSPLMPRPQTRHVSYTRGRSSTPSFTASSSSFRYTSSNAQLVCGFHPVYIKLTTAANFPHAKRLELAQPDYAWKLTLAATILAGFGFVAFRMVRPHF
ncbi:unnamed protein product [Hymenolepis diminuta]|uniref:Miro domain-containing protein n=1 Tax=Hymenolepis diminuta TaxID=6216 RepID=A0A158QCW9_HYMDI|nr:unnamed protein product [Hymenolepis diminuta]VUZ41700.1 unnamed protein product [Hymenolepis diminuta]